MTHNDLHQKAIIAQFPQKKPMNNLMHWSNVVKLLTKAIIIFWEWDTFHYCDISQNGKTNRETNNKFLQNLYNCTKSGSCLICGIAQCNKMQLFVVTLSFVVKKTECEVLSTHFLNWVCALYFQMAFKYLKVNILGDPWNLTITYIWGMLENILY